MTSKTMLLAAAAVLSLGVGSAFADSDGSGNSYFDTQFRNPDVLSGAGASTSPQRMTGIAAGDRPDHVSAWISDSYQGGGG